MEKIKVVGECVSGIWIHNMRAFGVVIYKPSRPSPFTSILFNLGLHTLAPFASPSTGDWINGGLIRRSWTSGSSACLLRVCMDDATPSALSTSRQVVRIDICQGWLSRSSRDVLFSFINVFYYLAFSRPLLIFFTRLILLVEIFFFFF